jgi:hypothetical protein
MLIYTKISFNIVNITNIYSMIPHLSPNDMKMFYNYLDILSMVQVAYQTSIRSNIQKIYSVESDIQLAR